MPGPSQQAAIEKDFSTPPNRGRPTPTLTNANDPVSYVSLLADEVCLGYETVM